MTAAYLIGLLVGLAALPLRRRLSGRLDLDQLHPGLRHDRGSL